LAGNRSFSIRRSGAEKHEVKPKEEGRARWTNRRVTRKRGGVTKYARNYQTQKNAP